VLESHQPLCEHALTLASMIAHAHSDVRCSRGLMSLVACCALLVLPTAAASHPLQTQVELPGSRRAASLLSSSTRRLGKEKHHEELQTRVELPGSRGAASLLSSSTRRLGKEKHHEEWGSQQTQQQIAQPQQL
jgi:hypothetical protein